MPAPRVTLFPLPGQFAICRLAADAPLPAWAASGPLVSITRTGEELSVVCAEDLVPQGARVERGWRCLGVRGPLDFALTGVLAALAVPLEQSGISLFAISTYDTDYVLVRDADFARTVQVLRGAGHTIKAGPAV
jgi:hypothetical protein